MASMTPTNLLDGISKASQRFQEPEFRMPNTAAVSTAYLGEKIDTPMSILRTREDRATYMDWIKAKADEGKTTRLHNHEGGRMDSSRTAISWGQVVDTFSISMKQLDNNSFSFDDVFAKGVLNSVRRNLVKFDNAYLALLKADKTQVNNANVSSTRGAFNSTDHVFELESTEQDNWAAMIEAVLQDNDYNDQLIALIDSTSFLDVMNSFNQGAANSRNTIYQFGNINFVKTNKTIFTGYNGSAIAMPAESVGLFSWIPMQNRKALDVEKAMTTVNGDFGMIEVPIYDGEGNLVYTIEAAISAYTQRADTSSLNGSKQDLLTQVEISWDYAYSSAPLSTSNESVVYGFGLKTGGATT